jgi:hypothetical protein
MYRICVLLVLALFGLHLLAAGPGASQSHAVTPQQAAATYASIQVAQTSAHMAPLPVGIGAGASSSEKTASAEENLNASQKTHRSRCIFALVNIRREGDGPLPLESCQSLVECLSDQAIGV